MKKVLCVTALATAMVISIQAVEEAQQDIAPIGVGLRAIMYPQGDIMPAATVRWAPSPFGGELLLGQMSYKDEGGGGPTYEGSMVMMAGKFYYAIIERENSCFYLGAKLGISMMEDKVSGTKITDETAVDIGGLMGAEWRPSGLPELGINFEVGYDFSSYEDDAGTPKYEGDHSGIVTSMGATYYF